MPLLISIDGPAASGKGTLARRLADYYHLAHLDTGLTYRAVAHVLIRNGWPLDDEAHAIEAARRVDLADLDKHALSAHAVGEAASRVAVIRLAELVVRDLPELLIARRRDAFHRELHLRRINAHARHRDLRVLQRGLELLGRRLDFDLEGVVGLHAQNHLQSALEVESQPQLKRHQPSG